MEKTTEEEWCYFLMSWRLRYNICNDALDDLLEFMSVASGQFDGPLSSFYKFNQFFKTILQDQEPEKMETYVFCPECKSPFPSQSVPHVCTCGTALSFKQLFKSGHTFLYSPLETALQSILEVQDNVESILKYNCHDSPEDVITDVVDSDRYKEIQMIPAPTCTEGSAIPRLTLQMNVDGVEVSKSSNSSLYPVMILINEFPPWMRQRNIIVTLLYRRGEVDFHDALLRILIKEMNMLYEICLRWTGYYGYTHHTQIVPYCLCTDSMMKYKLLGIKSPSGYSSCPNCKEKGAYLTKGKGGATCFPVMLDNDSNMILAEVRTVETAVIKSDGQESIPELISLKGFEDKLFESTAIDQMHSVFIGNMKALTKQIFFSTKVEAGLRKRRVEIADAVMQSVPPPSFFQRGVRPLSDYIHWKAHEWRSFFFYHMIPVSTALVENELMRAEQARHFKLYIIGVSLLNGDHILKQDIMLAKDMLVQFVTSIDNFYDIGTWTHNMHLTIHLPEMVQYLGPLWSFSMFKFEGFNRTILSSFNGSSYVLHQIGARLALRRSMFLLHDKLMEEKPLSLALQHSICRDTSKSKKDIKVFGVKPLKESSCLHVVSWYNDLTIGLHNLNLQSCSLIRFGCTKFGLYQYYNERKSKHMNCYIYNTIKSHYGEVNDIIIDLDRGNVFLLYYLIEAGDDDESSAMVCEPTLRYGVIGAETYHETKCELVNNCKLAIKVSMSDDKMFIGFRVNALEGS